MLEFCLRADSGDGPGNDPARAWTGCHDEADTCETGAGAQPAVWPS